MNIKSSKTLVSEALNEIKTISADEAFAMINEEKCNLIDIRDVRELENTGKPAIPSNKYKTIVVTPTLQPKEIPKNNTTKVCIVIGTG